MKSRNQICWSKNSNSQDDVSSLLCSFRSVDDGGSGQSSCKKIEEQNNLGLNQGTWCGFLG